MSNEFQLICEIEPATKPDLRHVRHQIGTLSKVASAFLIPDNHIGRATVSSVAVAHEVAQMGGRSIACLNARDRNLLGFQRDLLTAAAYGVDEFLFVHGDRPANGERTSELTVASMIEGARNFGALQVGSTNRFRVGTTSTLKKLPMWKQNADFLFVQVSFSLQQLLDWRASITFDGPVFAGVMVIASAAMARRLNAEFPQLTVPDDLLATIETNKFAGVDKACELINEIKESGAFEGVHLVPVSRYRELAARLEGF